MKIDTTKDIEEQLKKENPAQHYREHLSKYNGTGDAVVGPTAHPAETLMNYHSHDFFEINYVEAGTCFNMIEGACLSMQTGDMLLLHPDTLHTLYAGSECSVLNFLISVPWMTEFLSRAVRFETHTPFTEFASAYGSNRGYKYLFIPGEKKLTAKAAELVSTAPLPDNFRALKREALMTEMLLDISELDGTRLSTERGTSDSLFKSLYCYMTVHFDTVTLGSLAELSHYTKAHLCKMFRRHTGKTFGENITELRLQKARELLKNTSRSAEEIAREVGYESPEYFYRLFRKKCGCTPGEYRKNK